MDPFSLAAEEVRAHDRERFLADLYAPEAKRRYLFALHAFNLEIARVRDLVSDPLPGEIRLQWWRDVIAGQGQGEVAGNPLAAALLETIGLHDLPREAFDRLIEAKIFDLYNDPMPSLTDLEGYAGDTASALIQFGAIVLAGGDAGAAEAAGHGGVAQAIAGLLRALPYHARRGQIFLPADLMAKHGVDAADVLSGGTMPSLLAALTEMRALARQHLSKARAATARLPASVLPALLPLALVEPLLSRMERRDYDPFKTAIELPAWQRPWSIWRAARRGGF